MESLESCGLDRRSFRFKDSLGTPSDAIELDIKSKVSNREIIRRWDIRQWKIEAREEVVFI